MHLKNIVRERLCTIITRETIFNFRIQFFYNNGNSNDNNIMKEVLYEVRCLIIILIVVMMMMMNTTTISVVIVVKDEKGKRCKLIDITVPSEINTVPPQNLQLSRHKGLEIEIIRMWDMRTQIIPVVIGLIKKGPNKVTCRILGKKLHQ